MTPVPLEASILRAVTRHLKASARIDPTLVWRKRHGGPMMTAGDPDIHGVWRGVPFEIELKRPGESPTLLQQARLQEWARSGTRTAVVHSLDELQAFLNTIQPVV